MKYDFNKTRASWRKVAKAANDLNIARSIAKRSLIAMDEASPRLAFDAALAAAKPLRDIDWEGTGEGGGHTWATLELLGVEREEVPEILEALGALEEDITDAAKSPEAAYAALRKWAEAYRNPTPTQLPNGARF